LSRKSLDNPFVKEWTKLSTWDVILMAGGLLAVGAVFWSLGMLKAPASALIDPEHNPPNYGGTVSKPTQPR
jgi:hypothetical protein